MKNPSNPVHPTVPESPHRTCINNTNMNCRNVFRTLFWHASDWILVGRLLHFPAGLELHSPLSPATWFPSFPGILLNFVLYLPLYTSHCIPNFTSLHMEPTASQVRNHHSQKNQEVHLERALARAFKKTVNLHC